LIQAKSSEIVFFSRIFDDASLKKVYQRSLQLTNTLYITRRFAVNLGDYPIAEAYGKESVALFRELEDKRNLAWALRGLGEIHIINDEKERGEPLLTEAMTLFQEVDDKGGILYLLVDLGFDAIMNDEYERGVTLINEYQTLAHELDDMLSVGQGLSALALAGFLQGNIDEADKLLQEGFALIRPFGDKATFMYFLDFLAAVADKRRQPVRSARLWGAARHLGEITGDVPTKVWIRRIQEPTIASVRVQLGEAAFEAACAEGRAMTIDEAIEYALQDTND